MELFKVLKSEKLKQSNLEKIKSYSDDQVYELIELLDMVKPIYDSSNIEYGSPFNFFADSIVSGARDGCCSQFDCRSDTISALMYFSALYSDKVLIRDPFDFYEPYLVAGKIFPSIREFIIEDIKLLYQLQPLLDSGRPETARLLSCCCGIKLQGAGCVEREVPCVAA